MTIRSKSLWLRQNWAAVLVCTALALAVLTETQTYYVDYVAGREAVRVKAQAEAAVNDGTSPRDAEEWMKQNQFQLWPPGGGLWETEISKLGEETVTTSSIIGLRKVDNFLAHGRSRRWIEMRWHFDPKDGHFKSISTAPTSHSPTDN
jgi:hypothetical protein